MSTGYETDSSTGSNKRARFAGSADATAASGGRPAASGGPPANADAYRAPIELAKATADGYLASLHINSRNNIREHAHSVVQKQATYRRKAAALQDMKNNPEFIPSDAMINLRLHPVKGVEELPGFKELVRNAAEVVKNCRLLLREPLLKCTEMNVDQLLLDVQQDFVSSLPEIAELLIAEEGDVQYSPHRAVADLLAHHADEITGFIRLRDETFRALYCRVHHLDTFPQPLPTITQPSAASAGQQPPAAPGTDGTPRGDSQPTAIPPSGGPAAQRTQQHMLQAVGERAAAVLDAGELACLNGLPAETQRMVFALLTRQAPAPSSSRETNAEIQNINNPAGGGVDAMDEGGEELNAFDRIGLELDRRGQAAADTPDGAGGNGSPANPVPVTEGLRLNVRRRLLQTVKGVYVRPFRMYDEQMRANTTSLRIKKVATTKATTAATDKTAEAIEAEAQVDPKIVRIICAEEASKAVEKKLKAAKKKGKASAAEQANSSPGGRKNRSRGAKGSSSSKQNNASRRAKASTSADGGADRGRSVSDAAKASSRRRASKSRSRQKGNATKTRRS